RGRPRSPSSPRCCSRAWPRRRAAGAGSSWSWPHGAWPARRSAPPSTWRSCSRPLRSTAPCSGCSARRPARCWCLAWWRSVPPARGRGTAEPRRLPWRLPAACAWAGLAALAGLWLWNPYGAWPEWYTFVWLPALVGVLVPAPRPWAVLGIATVAGTAAALVTWGAVVEGRLLLAERDALGLGAAADPRAASLLARLGAT